MGKEAAQGEESEQSENKSLVGKNNKDTDAPLQRFFKLSRDGKGITEWGARLGKPLRLH